MVRAGSDEASDDAWRPPVPTVVATLRTEELAGYSGLSEVGRGGDSVVYRARQDTMGRDVAIKVLDLDTTADPARAARFAREVQLTVDLGRQHPNIVTVLDSGTTASGRPAIVMDFYEGGTLHDRLRSHGPLPPEEVGRIGEVLADALAFAHERGVLHRDVKPQNVLVLPTSWVLTDFGIARLVDAEHTSSAETFTYRHAAPQILDGLPPSPADDVWSLGSTLYTLLDSRPPFASDDPDDDSALAYLRRARTEPYRPLALTGAEGLTAIIDRCLRKDVAERWGSAAELRDALHGLRASAWEPVVPGHAPGHAPGHPPGHPPGPASPVARTGPAVPAYPPPTGPGVTGGTPPTRPDPPRPAVPEPPPIAVSALSAISHGHAAPGADSSATGHTGHTGRVDDTGSHADPSFIEDGSARKRAAEVAVPAEKPARRRLPLVLGAVALAVGLVLGLTATLLRGDDASSADLAPRATPMPEVFDLPIDEGTLRRRADPSLRPTLVGFEYDGIVLRMEWTDPTDRTGEFYLMLLTPGDRLGNPVLYSPPGTTSGEFEVDLPRGYACYYLLVVEGDGRFGIGDRSNRCVTVS